MEEGVFPHSRALTEPAEMEEERRLAYVGITRAQQRLYLAHAWSRQLFGSTNYNPPSRFIDEIPAELIDAERQRQRPHARTDGRAIGSARRVVGDPPPYRHGVRRSTTSGEADRHRERVVDAALAPGSAPSNRHRPTRS